MPQHPVYGLDIEIEADVDADGPIDPMRGAVRRVAVSTSAEEIIFDGDEVAVLGQLDGLLASIEPGVLTTWNGSIFDLPYLADRAQLVGVAFGLRLVADPKRLSGGDVLVGHVAAYRAGWYAHRHLDAARLFHAGRRPLIAVDELLRSFGWPVRGPRGTTSSSHEVTHEAVHAFAANDARLVRTLVEQRLPTVLRHLDRVPIDQRSGAVSVAGSRRSDRRVLSPAHPAVRAMIAGSS